MPNFQIVLTKQFALPTAFTFVTIRNVFLLSIVLSTATMLYSVSEMRGMFADGSNYIVQILASGDFFLLEPARKLVQLLQQSLLILRHKIWRHGLADTPARLFTFGALGWPIILTASCWFIPLRVARKGWIIGPLINLVALCPMTSLAAIGEGMIASCLLWMIFFLVLFRAHSIWGAILAISLTALGAITHESAAVFFVGIAAIAAIKAYASYIGGRAVDAIGDFRRRNLVGLLPDFGYPASARSSKSWRIPDWHSRSRVCRRLHGVNLTAVATIVSCVSIFWIMCGQHKGEKTRLILLSSVSFFALLAALLLFLPEWTVTPVAQFHGRGLPVLGTTVLSFGLWTGWSSGNETGIPAAEACSFGLVRIAAHTEC